MSTLHFIALCALLWVSCSDRQRLNPLDPQAGPSALAVGNLEAMAGDGQVDLLWDYSSYDDVEGYQLYRREGDGLLVPLTAEPLPAERTDFVDRSAVNGTLYEYSLVLLIAGQGERSAGQPVRATPGPETVWVADRGSGLVWKVNPDARSARFARGRFFDLRDIAVDDSDGSCWVSDGSAGSLYRIDAEGTLHRLAADLKKSGALEIDASAGIGWVADTQRAEVFWFSLASSDSLEFFVVDASLAEPAGLAAIAGACWIVDRLQGRAFLYSSRGQRLVEFRSLDRPSYVDAGPEGAAWVLVRDGDAMMRLDLDGSEREVELPFANARSLAVNSRDGSVWVVSERAMAHYNRDGVLLQQWEDVPTGRAIAVDSGQSRTWLATASTLWKFTEDGASLARLEGFSALTHLSIYPGRN